MGQVLKREHGGRRAAFAALLTTGMLAALLALTGIAAPAPAYAADQLKGTGTADDPCSSTPRTTSSHGATG